MDLCAVANDHPVWVQMNGEYKAILTKNACSVNPVTGLAHDGKSLAPYIPPLKQVGFTGLFIRPEGFGWANTKQSDVDDIML